MGRLVIASPAAGGVVMSEMEYYRHQAETTTPDFENPDLREAVQRVLSVTRSAYTKLLAERQQPVSLSPEIWEKLRLPHKARALKVAENIRMARKHEAECSEINAEIEEQFAMLRRVELSNGPSMQRLKRFIAQHGTGLMSELIRIPAVWLDAIITEAGAVDNSETYGMLNVSGTKVECTEFWRRTDLPIKPQPEDLVVITTQSRKRPGGVYYLAPEGYTEDQATLYSQLRASQMSIQDALDATQRLV